MGEHPLFTQNFRFSWNCNFIKLVYGVKLELLDDPTAVPGGWIVYAPKTSKGPDFLGDAGVNTPHHPKNRRPFFKCDFGK